MTLPNGLPPYTNQSAFDAVYGWLSRSGATPSITEDGIHCAYRGVDGNKCAIGCLIPDAEYDEAMERSSVYSVCSSDFAPCLQSQDLSIDLLEALQMSHDGGSHLPPDKWQPLALLALRQVAAGFGLTVPG